MLLNKIIENIIFKAGDLALGTEVIKLLNRHRKISAYSETELQKLQIEKLQSILIHSQKNSKYYQSLRINASHTTSPIEQLKQYPILTKTLLKTHLSDIVTRDTTQLIPYETSGSSGIPTKVWLDNKEESECRAILLNWWDWCGYKLGNPILQTGMTTERGRIKSFKDKITRTLYMNAFHLTEAEILTHLLKIKSTNYFLGGYASSLYVIAQVAEKHRLNISFKGVISWGDKMFDHYRAKIESVFSTTVYENYSCNEGLMIAQKVDLPYYYIYTPNIYLELLDEKGNEVPDGEIGKVVITKLDGFVTPLIRYETGDLAIKLPLDEYPQKRRFQFPLLKMVVGRDTDIIKTPGGSTLIVHTFTGIFEFYPEIKQFRVIQNEIDAIIIEYIPDMGFNNNILINIERDLKEKTQMLMKIYWKQVDFIPNTASGKPQLVINNLIRK